MADTIVDGVRYAFRFPADASTYTFVVVDTGALDASWRHDADFYIGKGGTGAAIGRRYAAFQEWLAAGNTVEPPEVGVSPQGRIVFGNGRHRFSVLRDMGKKHVVVMVRNADVVATRVAPYSQAVARWLLRDERKNAARVDAVIAGALAYAKPESRMSRSKSRTFTATLPDGRTVTRTSENHVYPFVVVVTNTQAEVAALQRVADAALATVTPEEREGHARLVEAYQKAWDTYKAARDAVEAAGGRTWDDPDLKRLLDVVGVWNDRVKKHPASRVLGTPAALLFPAQSLADAAARGVGKWGVLGWTSRRDLAEKMVSKEKGSTKYDSHPLRDVRILETTERA